MTNQPDPQQQLAATLQEVDDHTTWARHLGGLPENSPRPPWNRAQDRDVVPTLLLANLHATLAVAAELRAQRRVDMLTDLVVPVRKHP